jgi:hypothetical protein
VPNPEQGPQQQGVVGTWQTISLEIPDFLEPVRDAIDSFFSFLIRILDVLLAVLELLKVFLSGLLDPLIALIEAIRRLIEALLNDLRQLGIYIHGDFYALDGPDFQALKGGYLSYEARMVARLQDTSDPNRPDISELSTCLAVFLFVQADIRGINRIIQLIRAILNLFNRRSRNRMNSAVTNVQATYGYDGATIFSFNKGFFKAFTPRRSVQDNLQNPYNAVNLTWQLAPIPGAPFPDTPILPPAGFLVEFSTVEQPIKLVAERVIEGSAQDMDLNNQPSKTEVVDVLDEDGNPILLRGGIQQVDVRGTINWNDAVNFQGEFKSDAVRIYGIKNLNDQSPIPLDQLQDGDKYFYQKTFYVPVGQNLFFPGKGYGATFLFDDMPYDADFDLNTGLFGGGKITRKNDDRQPERFFVRVRAVSRDIKSATDYQFVADQTALRDREGPVLPLKSGETISLLDAGPPSAVTPILFPDASTELYLRAVAEALAILVLSRSDLPVLIGKSGPVDFPPTGPNDALANGIIEPFWSGYEDHARLSTGLEDLAKFLMVQLTGRRQVKKYFNEAGASLPKFRRKLFINCINLTNRYLTQNLPPLAARQLAVERAEDLLNFKIFKSLTDSIIATTDPNFPGDLQGGSVLELLRSDDPSFGISPNTQSYGIAGGRISDNFSRQIRNRAVLPRAPHFFFASVDQATGNPRGRGSVDMAPVVYSRTGARLRDIEFFRNLVPDSVYEGAQFVLQVAAGPQVRPQERGWIAFRLFPQGIPAIDRFFDQILALLRAIQAAIESIAETIRRYIEFLQSRIRELQAFLNRLNALIQRLLRFFLSITPAAGLVVVAPGTDGVTSALIGAQNKPIAPANPQADSYGGGIVLFAGGIPNLAIDVFAALFKGDT